MRRTIAETQHQTLTRIFRAMDRQQPITIDYLKADGTRTVRTIEVHDVTVSAAGDLLIKAMDRESQDRRSFRLDRIVAYVVHRSRYTVPISAGLEPATERAYCDGCADLVPADAMTGLVCDSCAHDHAERDRLALAA